MAFVFANGQGIMVTTHGQGNLHLYSYGKAGRDPGVFGYLTTSKSGTTKFVISHSYGYNKYAFFWDGPGEAEYCIGGNPKTHPVGRSWSAASWLKWGDKEVSVLDVSPDYFAGATDVGHLITCFVIPEDNH